MKFLNFNNYARNIKDSKSIHQPNNLDRVEVILSTIKRQKVGKWNQGDEIIQKRCSEIMIGNLGQIPCRVYLSILCKFHKEFEDHRDKENSLKKEHDSKEPFARYWAPKGGHISIKVGANKAAEDINPLPQFVLFIFIFDYNRFEQIEIGQILFQVKHFILFKTSQIDLV
jgi:hypothetical protein